MMQVETATKYAVWLAAIQAACTIVIALIGVWTLALSRKIHVLTNSAKTALENQNATLTKALGVSRENEATSAAKAGLPQPEGAAADPVPEPPPTAT